MIMLEFSLLTAEKQIEELYKGGVYIGKLENNKEITMLYQLDSFYVEITFSNYRKFISKIKCYDTMDKLLCYIEQVTIDEDLRCVEK